MTHLSNPDFCLREAASVPPRATFRPRLWDSLQTVASFQALEGEWGRHIHQVVCSGARTPRTSSFSEPLWEEPGPITPVFVSGPSPARGGGAAFPPCFKPAAIQEQLRENSDQENSPQGKLRVCLYVCTLTCPLPSSPALRGCSYVGCLLS